MKSRKKAAFREKTFPIVYLEYLAILLNSRNILKLKNLGSSN